MIACGAKEKPAGRYSFAPKAVVPLAARAESLPAPSDNADRRDKQMRTRVPLPGGLTPVHVLPMLRGASVELFGTYPGHGTSSTPMMIAVWDDARRVDRVHSRRTEPRSTSASALGRDVTA